MIQFRLLAATDAPAFQQLRFTAINNDEAAFLSVAEVEQAKLLENYRTELLFAQNTPPFGYYGLFDHGTLIGFLQLGSTGLPKQRHIGYFYNLYLEPSYRHQGVGTYVCRTVLDLAQAAGLERIFAVCLASNKTAFALYQKLGFEVCGRRHQSAKWKNQYDDEVELMKVL
jgi:ribosomal protein S18 acetylase RimI-like enzyme